MLKLTSAVVLVAIMACAWLFLDNAHVVAQSETSRATPVRHDSAVLILSGLQKGYPIPDAVTESAYQRLREHGMSISNIFVEYLDIPRQRASGSVIYKLNELRAKLSVSNVHAAIVAEDSALSYLEHAELPIIAANVPIITTLTEDVFLKPQIDRMIINIFPGFDVERTLNLGLSLFPGTKRVVVVEGPGTHRAPILPQVQSYISLRASPLEIEDVSALEFSQMLERVSQLPADTLVLYGNYFVDATGASFVPADVAKSLSEHANSPVLALYESHVRSGLFGGSVIRPNDLGHHAAEVVQALLAGARQYKAGVSFDPAPTAVMFDWAELKRWQADPAKLPPDTIFLNKPPSMWDDYREFVISVGVALALLAMMVVILQRLVAARTRTVNERNVELNEALELAESSRQAESRFLSNMSHEIRNPLNGVSGLITLALSETSLDEIRAHLRTADLAAQHLSAIVNDILDYKKLESGDFSLRNESFDYMQLRAGNRSINERLAAEKNITIEYPSEQASLPRFLIGDAIRLNQIGLNVVSNAVKFTPEGGTIRVGATYDDDREELTVTVKDTGIGMSAETVSHLFERYYQGAEGHSKEHPGTGLGLAIVKGILDQMGGTITVESELGKGTTVTTRIRLPVDRERENATRDGALGISGSTEPVLEDLTGIAVLCVDDDPTNLTVLVSLLDKAGAEVSIAKSGIQALNVLSKSHIDIVLSDISMPGMDGIALRQEIKHRYPSIPVVAVTGNVLEEDVRRYLANGFVAVLAKPFDFGQCVQTIRRYVVIP